MRTTQIRFTPAETKDLLKSWAGVTLVFAIAFVGFGPEFWLALIVAGITAGLGFILHELAHKFVANYFGCSAEYRANLTMLGFSLLIAIIFKAIFIAPGAVMVRGVQSQRENGIISAAGPAANIVIAGVCLLLQLFTQGGFWDLLFTYGILINAWLALFNMIPVLPFDGRKIWMWNKAVYVAMVIISGALLATELL